MKSYVENKNLRFPLGQPSRNGARSTPPNEQQRNAMGQNARVTVPPTVLANKLPEPQKSQSLQGSGRPMKQNQAIRSDMPPPKLPMRTPHQTDAYDASDLGSVDGSTTTFLSHSGRVPIDSRSRSFDGQHGDDQQNDDFESDAEGSEGDPGSQGDEEDEDLTSRARTMLDMQQMAGGNVSYPSTTSGYPDPDEMAAYSDGGNYNHQQHYPNPSHPQITRLQQIQTDSPHYSQAEVRQHPQTKQPGHQRNQSINRQPAPKPLMHGQALPHHSAISPTAAPPSGPSTKDNGFVRTAAVKEAQESHLAPPEDEQRLEPDFENHHDVSDDTILDYDEPELFKMDYAQLRDENFDHVPNRNKPTFPGDIATSSLPVQLQHAQRNFKPAEQSAFLSGLSNPQWEDAGEWFVERFADMVKSIVNTRKTKRKIAAELEKEVELRDGAVARKKLRIEHEMDAMKAGGMKLLSPRKAM